ncbi:hypothetical protein [Arthrobacter sp. NPDC056727]|uniref:hypothetical protein n=1 Tax=Arthrobacter sp. NPDC056727 TaxID=3345927 RepID=UPI00366EBE56
MSIALDITGGARHHGGKSNGGNMEATHSEPVWRDKANFIIAATVGSSATEVTTEQLWVRKIDGMQYEICCIPFFVL